jgi:hypothetical protein
VHQDSHWLHLDLGLARALPRPVEDRADGCLSLFAGLCAGDVFEQQAKDDRKPGDLRAQGGKVDEVIHG